MENDHRKNALIEKEGLRKELRKNFIAPYPEVEKKEGRGSLTQRETEESEEKFELEFKRGTNKKDYIVSLFSRSIFAELYFAWCKDCGETISIENAKYFRDEVSMRNNKGFTNFNFRSMRVNKNFLMAFIGNLDTGMINKLDLSDNMISDVCMHNIKTIISNKKVVFLNLSSNMISSEGLKIIQNELMSSDSLTYLNLGILEGSFRRNNLSGEGGLVIARILLANESLTTLVLQDNDLGEDGVEKIGTALIQNKILTKLKISDNKSKNKGARAILENANKLISLNLSNNLITSEVCYELKRLIESSSHLQELNWDSNNIGVKGIKYIVEGIYRTKSLRYLSIKNTNIGNPGLKILAEGLKPNKILHSLDISSNSITYDSFSHLCDSLETNMITTIKCKNNLLGDESMEYFAEKILVTSSTASVTYFDFSSCKIYDQGLIYLLSKLTENNKITKIKLRDNYFSHEIDYVIIDFITQNTKLKFLDFSKNRFSYQCMQKIQKIVDRNIKMETDREPNKLLIEIYRLKYENTKLNEMKECLKFLENDVEKIKLNRAEIRQDYESFKYRCDEDYEELKKKNDKLEFLLDQRRKEHESKIVLLETTKVEFSEQVETLFKTLTEIKDKKNKIENENSHNKSQNEEKEKQFISKIEVLHNKIEENKTKESEYNKLSKEYMEEIIRIDKLINEKSNK